jgi:adenylate cyclase
MPEALWPLVSDTDRFNRATGVPPVEDRARADWTPHNARRRLRLVRFGVPLEWEEEPFEWIRPRSFGVVRRYIRGPMAEMRVLAELNSWPDGGTQLVYQVWAHARSLLGFAGIPIQVGLVGAKSFGAAFHLFDRLAAYKQSVLDLPACGPLAPGGRARLDAFKQTLINRGQNPELVALLAKTIVQADDLSLARLRPYVLADHWGLPRQAVLKLCLWATRVGLLDFQWDLLCPSCRGAKQSSSTLREMQSEVHCDVCRIDFNVNFERFVELTFRPNPAVREIDARPFCVGGPQITPHIVAQQLLAPSARRSFSLALDVGSYRVRALELPGFQSVRVAADGASELTFRVADEGWPADEACIPTHPTLYLENVTGVEQLLILERTMWSDQAVTAAEAITLQTFRDLFASEALRPGRQISVGSLTVVFTDLRGSTHMYGAIGDAPAFGRVMDHFEVLRGAIDAEGGSVVKTIGDAVMAVFRRPLAAVRAMLNAQQTLAGQTGSEHPLVLKVGIHYGPCISVTLNERLDFFGSTVNIAARIQNLAAGDDIVVSETVWRDPEVADWITHAEPSLAIEPFQANLKGIDGAHDVWRLRR